MPRPRARATDPKGLIYAVGPSTKRGEICFHLVNHLNLTENRDRMAIPAFLEPLLARQYGADLAATIVEGLAAKRAVTLRANTLLSDRDAVAEALDQAGISWEPVGWYRDAFALPRASQRDVWGLPAYESGHLYMQSLSSMIPPLALGAHAGEDICDMCAAPGGKTTQIAALTGAGARITACEMHAPRAEKLEFNLNRQSARNVTVMRTDARRLDDFFSFDRILLDAPCSGSGTLSAADPRVEKRFTPHLIEKSRKSQQALFDKALKLLKPGGTLVYSTCSILREENEAIVEEGLRRAPRDRAFSVKPFDLDASSELPRLPVSLEGALCLAPTDRYEGFFVAKIVRTG